MQGYFRRLLAFEVSLPDNAEAILLWVIINPQSQSRDDAAVANMALNLDAGNTWPRFVAGRDREGGRVQNAYSFFHLASALAPDGRIGYWTTSPKLQTLKQGDIIRVLSKTS